MADINLLPWREQARTIKKINFSIVVGACVVITIFIVLLSHLYLSGLINRQQFRNTYLQSELTLAQTRLSTLNDKLSEQEKINTDLHFYIALRGKNYGVVKLLNEFAKIVPEAVTLDALQREGDDIMLLGKAQSNLQITLFMKNIKQSSIFNQPELTEITGQESKDSSDKIFKLKVKIKE